MKQAKEKVEEYKIGLVLAVLDGNVRGCGCGKVGEIIFKTAPRIYPTYYCKPCDDHRHLWDSSPAWERYE
jgi:hypothetical protein